MCELDTILTQKAICVMQGHPSFVLKKLSGLTGGSIRLERSRHSQGVSGSKGFVFSATPKMSGAPKRSHTWVGRWAGVVSAAQGGWGLASFRLRKFRPKSTGAAMGFGDQRFWCDVWWSRAKVRSQPTQAEINPVDFLSVNSSLLMLISLG